jgi:hypothetical protein
MGSLLARAQQKIFGSSAGTSQFGQIGSQTDGAPVTTKDLATIQSLSHFLLGLYSITNNATQPPFVEDINALYLLITQQLAYIFQAGISEYDAGTNYFNLVSYVQVNGVIYQSINGTDLAPNVGNDPTSSPTFWRKLIDTDVNLAANSDSVITSQKATKTYVDAENTRALAAESLLAPKASPTFTGTVTVPTASAGGAAVNKTQMDAGDLLSEFIVNKTISADTTDTLSSMAIGETRTVSCIISSTGTFSYFLNGPGTGTYDSIFSSILFTTTTGAVADVKNGFRTNQAGSQYLGRLDQSANGKGLLMVTVKRVS